MEIPKTRAEEVTQFADLLYKHVTSYANEQYGEKGNDRITTNTIRECLDQCKKYIERYGRQQREGQQHADFLKMAHYVCCAFWKFQEAEQTKENDVNSITDFKIFEIQGKKFVNIDGKTYLINEVV